MNQKRPTIYLRELVENDFPFGIDQGREAYKKLLTELDNYIGHRIIGISLKGIRQTDASFPRESVVFLAKAKKGEIGIFLLDFEVKELIENWDYAAKAKDQSMIVIQDKGFQVIGPNLTDGAYELLMYIMKKDEVTTSMVAEAFDITAQNASGRLKKLLSQGLILGTKEVSETGGLEYIFKAIK